MRRALLHDRLGLRSRGPISEERSWRGLLTGRRGLDLFLPAAILATLPIERVLTVDVAGFTVRPVFLFMALFTLLHLSNVRGGIAAMPTTILVFVAVLASFAGTYDTRGSLAYALWAIFVATFSLVVVGHLRNDAARLATWLDLYVATAGLWALVAIAQWVLAFASPALAYDFLGPVPRLHALTYEPSFLAFYLTPPLFLAAASRRPAWGIPILVALVLSTSRAGVVGVALGALVFLVLGDRLLRRRMVTAALAGALAVAAMAVPFALGFEPDEPDRAVRGYYEADGSETSREELDDFVQFRDDASVNPRLQTWIDGWEMFREEPVTGVGVGAFGAASHARGIALHAPESEIKTTNLWIEVMAEMGIVGFVALALWSLLPVPLLWKARRRTPVALPILAAVLASVAMFPFVQTWWVPYRWIPWLFAYAVVGSEIAAWVGRRRVFRAALGRARPSARPA